MRWTNHIACLSLMALAAGPATVLAALEPSSRQSPASPTNAPSRSFGGRGGPFNFPPTVESYTNSPVHSFRALLTASPEEREKLLEGKSDHTRRFLLGKLAEYDVLSPADREARLKSTELRWYLTPLMRRMPSERAEFVAAIPEPERTIVSNRLQLWDQLSPELQAEVLEHERLISLVLRVEGSGGSSTSAALQKMSPDHQRRTEADLARWQALPMEQRDRMLKNFHQFFDLPDREKVATLGTLNDNERRQMEQTLERFQRMTSDQRTLCLKSFRKFKEMTPEDQDRFLKNAALWEKMTAEERATWKTLVSAMPPLPPGFPKSALPPSPPLPAGLPVPPALPPTPGAPSFTNK